MLHQYLLMDLPVAGTTLNLHVTTVRIASMNKERTGDGFSTRGTVWSSLKYFTRGPPDKYFTRVLIYILNPRNILLWTLYQEVKRLLVI